MVSKAGIHRKKRSRPNSIFSPTHWFATDPNKGRAWYGPCFAKCKKYTPTVKRTCAYGNCTEWYCGKCYRFSGGMGPVGCPCDYYGNCSGAKGHGTPEEQVSRTYHIVPNTDPEAVSYFIVTPSRKRKAWRRERRGTLRQHERLRVEL